MSIGHRGVYRVVIQHVKTLLGRQISFARVFGFICSFLLSHFPLIAAARPSQKLGLLLPNRSFYVSEPYLASDLIQKEKHSESHLVESREYWWNNDYLELLSQRLDFKHCNRMADIGCGQGMMSFLLAPFLPENALITGIDSETKYLKRAKQKARKVSTKHQVSFNFVEGDAQRLPLESNSQDMAFCQTLLIHMQQPEKVLGEMKRIVKKGGYVVAIEPNNLASNLMFDNYSQTDYNVEEMLDFLEIRLRCEKGKRQLGEGFNSIGDALPDLFAKAGLSDLEVFISDKSLNLIPPYNSREKRLRAAQLIEWIENQTGGFGYDENLRYYKAGGGGKKSFDAYWQKAYRYQQNMLTELKNQECFLSGGNLMYVVVGRVPE
ncbi:methyltransferase domain-containing protein [bacterium]|nr:methyltransferase domain-containing protein [bacterium]